MRNGSRVRLELHTAFDALELVQVVSDRMSALAGFDEDAVHWVGVSVRECVINAIKHGNREDATKLIIVEFRFIPREEPSELVVTVLDQGDGFDPVEIANPLAPENILKSSGRGIFFMRSFMDDVTLRRAPQGGMEVRLVKRLLGQDGAGPVAETSSST